jgi:DNA-binding transcriptional LysR family regulator
MSRPSRTTRREYKDLTLQQLRSFCETARLGSFMAAASSLGLSHPTVWKQVHALEKQFGSKLVEPFGRGCRLTEAGRILTNLASPAVTTIASLKRHFQESLREVAPRLTIATTPRILVEDLPECVAEFERLHPRIHLTLKEFRNEEVLIAVESGEADLGLTSDCDPILDNPWLSFEPCYEVDVILVTPEDHPLARRRRVHPRDLLAYPVVNAPAAFGNSVITTRLEQLGLFQTQPRRVEAFHAYAICRFVEMGFGIGLIGSLPTNRSRPRLHVRPMTRDFGPLATYAVLKKSHAQPEIIHEFINVVKSTLSSGPG